MAYINESSSIGIVKAKSKILKYENNNVEDQNAAALKQNMAKISLAINIFRKACERAKKTVL